MIIVKLIIQRNSALYHRSCQTKEKPPFSSVTERKYIKILNANVEIVKWLLCNIQNKRKTKAQHISKTVFDQ